MDYRDGASDILAVTSLRLRFSAVTGACLLVRKSVFEEVGGLNETDLAVAFNDVDFCLRQEKTATATSGPRTLNYIIMSPPVAATTILRKVRSFQKRD